MLNKDKKNANNYNTSTATGIVTRMMEQAVRGLLLVAYLFFLSFFSSFRLEIIKKT